MRRGWAIGVVTVALWLPAAAMATRSATAAAVRHDLRAAAASVAVRAAGGWADSTGGVTAGLRVSHS